MARPKTAPRMDAIVEAETIDQAAERLVDVLESVEPIAGEVPPIAPEPEPKKRGRPRKDSEQVRLAAEQAERSNRASRDQRVAILSMAITGTLAPLIDAWSMQPAFTLDQGRALAEAWDAVLVMYLDRGGPWSNAVMVTAIVMLPYLMQGAARLRDRRKARTDPVELPGPTGV